MPRHRAEDKDLKVRFANTGCGFGGLIDTCMRQEFADALFLSMEISRF
jgi:hypothetical protein